MRLVGARRGRRAGASHVRVRNALAVVQIAVAFALESELMVAATARAMPTWLVAANAARLTTAWTSRGILSLRWDTRDL